MMSSLEVYNKKRNFVKTTEPKGIITTSHSKDFMVHLHDARRLHYDLRLQWNNVLLSWAVPKGPSYNPDDKRLAVQTEDHPIEYKSFEGVIPEKNYGAGPSLIWDVGLWRPLVPDVNAALKKGRLRFMLKGVRLKGVWNLILMRSKNKNSETKQWLLIKEKDKYASKTHPVDEIKSSLATGRDLDEFLDDKLDPELDVSAAPELKHKPTRTPAPASIPKVKSQPNSKFKSVNSVNGRPEEALDEYVLSPSEFPSELKPQLAQLAKKPPFNMEDYFVERKYDGYRIVAFKKSDSVELLTRNGKRWQKKFESIAEAIKLLPFTDAIFDGEVVAYKNKNDQRENFKSLQNFLNEEKDASLEYVIFDLLYLDGYDLTDKPQWVRRKMLIQIFESVSLDALRLSEVISWRPELVDEVCAQGQEGLMLKEKNAEYEQRRSPHWLKLKCGQREEFLVIGWTKPQGSRSYFGALLLGEVSKGGVIQYRGRVGSGFDEDKLKEILDQIRTYEIDKCPAENCDEKKDVHFISPHFFAEVRYSEKTEQKLRHPVFLGIRKDKFFDKNAKTDKMQKSNKIKSNKKIVETKLNGETLDYQTSVKITSPGRVLFPEQNLTKKDLLGYYYAIFDEFLKLGGKRPLSLVRCPRGEQKSCFFQKHLDLDQERPPQVKIKTSSGSSKYSYIEKFDDLASLVQLGTLEFHAWNCQVDQIDFPQYVVWDIDPSPEIEFASVTQTAHLIKLILQEMQYPSFVRSTGGKGLHVLCPNLKKLGWKEAKAFSLDIGKLLLEAMPDLYILKSTLKLRKNKIFIDYLRNSKSATSILNYSTRAKRGAPVCTPLFWDEVHEDLNPQEFTLKTTIQRLQNQKEDPWKEFYKYISQLK